MTKKDKVKKPLRDLADWLRSIRETNDKKLLLIAASIRKNTDALTDLSTYPPRKDPPMSTDPGQSVNDALSAQTDAIAKLSQELADEHQEWLDAVEAGDTGQADAIVAKVKANTDQLNALSEELAGSHPGSSTEPEVNPL